METDIKPQITTVFLTTQEAEQFLLFQKHYNLFMELENNRIMDIKFGKAILNFAFGELQNIVKEEIVYKKL